MSNEEENPFMPRKQLNNSPARAKTPPKTRKGTVYSNMANNAPGVTSEQISPSSRGQTESVSETLKKIVTEMNTALRQEIFHEIQTSFRTGLLTEITSVINKGLTRTAGINDANASNDNPRSDCNVNKDASLELAQSNDNTIKLLRSSLTSQTIAYDIDFQSFWKHAPESWFDTLESQLRIRGIQDDEIKYWNVMKNLGADAMCAVQGVIETIPKQNKFDTIKRVLIDKYSETTEQKLTKLFRRVEIDDRKPSLIFEEMIKLAGTCVPRETIVTVWKNSLPGEILLFVDEPADKHGEKKMIEQADRAYHLHKRKAETEVMQINAVTDRDATKSQRVQTSSDLFDRLV